MANKEHLAKLSSGASIWNAWREQNFQLVPDLSGAIIRVKDLHGIDLSGANLRKTQFVSGQSEDDDDHTGLSYANRAELPESTFDHADLTGADLRGANLAKASLHRTILCKADLRNVDFRSANLSESNLREACCKATVFSLADLRGVDLSHSQLGYADFSGADVTRGDLSATELTGTDFRRTNLRETDFRWASLSHAELQDANFAEVIISHTTFADVDLSNVREIETIRHYGPSHISIDTICRSKGSISHEFLRSAGVPEPFITNMRSLVAAMEPTQFYSCFISYSSEDQDFADQLHRDLKHNGIRCWFAPKDLPIGSETRSGIDDAIRTHDKLLVVLSQNSVKSSWVKKEVETAFDKESKEGRIVLFPIRLDNAVMNTNTAWAADIRRMRNVGDFSNWQNGDSYRGALERLLRDLRAERKAKSAPE